MENFDSLKGKILTVWKGKFWQFEKENFDNFERKIFWQSEKEIFDSLKTKNFDSFGDTQFGDHWFNERIESIHHFVCKQK
jgi:hypothetical protein